MHTYTTKDELMNKWRGKGLVDYLYDLVLLSVLLLTVLGGFQQGISPLFLFGIGLTVLLVYLRRYGKVKKVNIVSIFIIVFAFIYGTELYLTFYSIESNRIRDGVKKGFDLRSNMQVYDDLQHGGRSPVLVITPSILLGEKSIQELDKESIFPLGGISNRTTVLCNETGKWAIYNSDEHGFNNPRGLYKSGIDLLLIGDSFTHGYCVDQEQTIAANLRKQFPTTISIGAGGNGELSRLASLIEYGPTLKPKAVLWIYTENTWGRVWQEMSNPILHKYFQGAGFKQGLYEKQIVVDELLEKYLRRKVDAEPRGALAGDFAKFIKFAKLRSQLVGTLDVFRAQKAHDQDTTEVVRNILSQAKKATESWGGKFYFVYLATPHPSYGPSDHDKVLALAKELELNTIDSFAALSNANLMEIMTYADHGHYNAEGYRLFSKVVLDSLSSR